MIQYSGLNIEKLRSVYMSYKMLVLDIDDTLLNSNHEISSVTKERLIQFQEDGFILVLATGRPTKSAVQKPKNYCWITINHIRFLLTELSLQVWRMRKSYLANE